MTGRLPSITEDSDSLALLTAYAAGGALPASISRSSLEAFALAGWLDAEHPSRLSQLGMDTAATWAEIKERTAAGFRRGGRFTPISPRGEGTDMRRAAETRQLEEHGPDRADHLPAWRR